MPLPILLLRKRKLRHSLGRPSRSDFVQPEVVEYLKNERRKLISFDEMEKQRADHEKRAQLFIAVEKNTGINDEERWKDNPPEAGGELEIAAASEPIVPGSRIMRI